MTSWITSAAIQGWLGSDVDDPTATELAMVVTDAVRDYIEREIELASYTEVLDSNGTNFVLVNYWPIQTLTSIAINGEPPLVPAAFNVPGYQLDPVNKRKIVFPGRKVARGVSNIAVAYTAGYDLTAPIGSATGLPGSLWQALKLTASAIYNSAAADPNLTSENTAGVFSGSFQQAGVGAIPPGARSYLQPFKRVAP